VAKRTFRKIPAHVRSKITGLDVDDVIVACAKRINRNDIAQYGHLSLRVENGQVVLPAPTVPAETIGRYCSINVNGKEVLRKDLPMITKTYTFEVPNYGDWYNGSHDVTQTRAVYQRDLIPPKELTVSVELLEEDAETITVKVAVDQVLSRTTADFEDDLLYNLNILQEVLGFIDVFGSQATFAEFLRTVRVNWEILPAGRRVEEVLEDMLRNKRPVTVEKQRQMLERLAVLNRMNPREYIAGTSEFLRYFGARFDDDFVVFENLNYGNAVYVMYERWEELSQRSRIDLLKGPRAGFERVPHTENWERRLKDLLRQHLEAKARQRPAST
jgi:hypothetical protein